MKTIRLSNLALKAFKLDDDEFVEVGTSITLLLKVTRLLNLAPKAFGFDKNEVIGVGGRANKVVVNLSKNEKSRNLTYMLNLKAIKKPNFLTSYNKNAFNHLQLAFIKALITWHFDLKSHIQIKINASSHAIDRVLS